MLGIFLGALFGAIAIGVPIVFALILCGIALMLFSGDSFNGLIIAQKFVDGTNNFALMAIPFFILAGELMNKSGITERIIHFAMSIIGHVRGGLGYVVIGTSIIFAGLSGSAVADIAAVGTALIPIMASYGYNKNSSTGLVMASGIIGPIIPPSITFIIFGVTTGTSIVGLFMAGIIPGLLIGIGLALAWYIVSKKHAPDTIYEPKSKKKILKLGLRASWALVLPIVIIGGLRIGIFTPTEAGVVAVFYALFVGFIVYRELKIKDLYDALISSALTTSVIMFVVGGATVASWFITTSGITQDISEFFMKFVDSPLLIMILVVFLLLVVGMVMDTTPAILILAPLFMPIIQLAGIDPIYFGVVFCITLIIGMLTPPVGIAIFTGMGVAKISMQDAMNGVWPFLLVEVIVLFLLVLFPQIITGPLKLLM